MIEATAFLSGESKKIEFCPKIVFFFLKKKNQFSISLKKMSKLIRSY